MALAPLAGFTVAVTADRRREEQVELLRRRGAAVVEGPTVRTVPLVDDARLREAIDELIARPPEISVLTTGVGMRGMVAAAEGLGREEVLLDALAASYVVARGPKAVGAAIAAGIDVAWRAPTERNHEVVDHVAGRARAGARIAVQRDGDERPVVAETLADLGADVVDVPVYRWVLPEDTAPAARLVDAVCDGAVDAVTFTSSPAIRNLFLLADEAGRRDDLVGALDRGIVAACVGPVCVSTLRAHGVTGDLAVPARARLGAMVQAVVVALSGRVRRLCVAGVPLTVQGRTLVVDHDVVQLTDRERRVFEVLLRARGAVVPKRLLVRDAWAGAVEEHAVEVTVARLRRRLGPAGGAVETVPRRGYRLGATPAPL